MFVWLSWESGRFQYQRSAVRIQSSAKFIEHLFTVNCIEKTKINKKRGREWPIFLRKIQNMGSSFKSFHSRGGMSCLAKHVFLNGPSPASFSFIFGLFNKQYITIFTANQCEKSQSSIQRRDSNPRPLEHESSPITTRQGRLSGKICLLCLRKGKDMW